jgi:hypothetical protein
MAQGVVGRSESDWRYVVLELVPARLRERFEPVPDFLGELLLRQEGFALGDDLHTGPTQDSGEPSLI